MSVNQNNSVLIKSVQHTSRFLNANLTSLSSNNHNMFNLQNNNGRKFSKSVSISNTLNPASLPTNASLNSYQYHYSNTANSNAANGTNSISNNTNSSGISNSSFTNSNQSSFPSMIKNSMTPSFASTRKFTTDYQQAVRFDYSDAFVNNHNIDFLTRVSQMQRLQMETVDWERKRKLSKKKLPGTGNETTSNINNNSNKKD